MSQIPSENRDRALEMRANGMTYEEIGKSLGSTRQWAWLLINGTKPKPRKARVAKVTPLVDPRINTEDSSPRSMVWADWLKNKRKSKGLNRRELAELTKINPSYVTLMERDGYIPKKHILARIGLVLGDPDAAFIAADYLPPSLKRAELASFLRCKPPARMPEDVAPMVRDLCEAPRATREQVVNVARALLDNAKPTTKRSPRNAV